MKNSYSTPALPSLKIGRANRILTRIPVIILLALLLSSNMGWGQALLIENFDYTNGSAITANGWTAHSSGGTNPILVTNPSTISYSGYLSSGVGGEVTLVTSGEDDNKAFTAQTSGTVYSSFLVYVTSATTAGDYFFHAGANTIGSTYKGRVYVKRDASNNLAFGISQGGGTIVYSAYSYAMNITYLLVLRYEIITGTNNDISSIYINPQLNAPVPTTGWITNSDATTTDLSDFGSVALRQGSSSNAAGLKLDGIRVSTNWEDIVGSASTPSLSVNPSTLSGFTYNVGGGPSTSQTYTLSGTNLTGGSGNIVVACTTNYEVSTNGMNFFSSLNVPYTGTTLDATTIHVRLEAGLSAGTFNSETVSNSGGGATTQNVTCNGYVVGGATTYTWTGATDNDWQVSTNWTPTRTSPAVNDKLVFDNTGTYTITNVPGQTIAQMSVTSGTKISLQAASASTLTIAGDTGDDLVVTGSGSELNITGTSAMILSLNTGATGQVSGTMTLSGAAHRLYSTDSDSFIFLNGSSFTVGTGFSGSVFGSVNINSIEFQSGSTYIHMAGSNPFAATAPASVVEFQTGSLFKYNATSGTPSFSGRTYANFELDAPGASISPSGSTGVSIDNLTVTNGTLNFNVTTNPTPGHKIKGNISVATGATLNFNPSAAGTVNFNGTSAQSITSSGTIGANAFSTLNVDNVAGVKLNSSATFNNLTITSGTFTLASGASLITTGTVPASVIAERYIAGWPDNIHGWHLLSSPMTSQAISPAFTDPTPANYDFYKWDEVNNIWLNQKEVANGITNFDPGTGYLVAYQSAGTKQFAGTLNTANVTVSGLTLSGGANSGWNLAGNPFPCALVWNDGVNWTVPATIGGNAKVWDESGAAYDDVAAGGIIPALNGFMIQVTSGSPTSMTIPTAARTHNATPWYKTTPQHIKLIAYDRTSNTNQESIISINEMASEGFDAAYDSRFLAGYAPMFYSIAGSEYLSTNALPDLNPGRTIEMGFVKNDAADFSIGLDPESAMPGIAVYLTDKKTGVVTDLTQNKEYAFTSVAGDATDRFRIHFGALGIDDPATEPAYTIYSSKGQIYISSDETGDADVKVINLLGQTVMHSRTSGSGMTVIDAGNLENGIYMINVIHTSQVISQKVFISR
jgi:hypothetical protein